MEQKTPRFQFRSCPAAAICQKVNGYDEPLNLNETEKESKLTRAGRNSRAPVERHHSSSQCEQPQP